MWEKCVGGGWTVKGIYAKKEHGYKWTFREYSTLHLGIRKA